MKISSSVVNSISSAVDLAGSQKKLATLIGVSPQTVNLWLQADRTVSPECASQIELATDRQVMRWDLRPDDWWRIWPELIGLEGAPAVPDKAAA